MGIQPAMVDVTTTNTANKTASFQIPIPFRLDRRDPYDLTAALPARHLSTAQVEIHWNAASDLGNDHTINSATAELSLHEFILNQQEQRQLWGVGGSGVLDRGNGNRLVAIHQSETKKTVDQTEEDFNYEIELPTGATLLSDYVVVKDDGARDDNLLEKLRIKQHSPTERSFEKATWGAVQRRNIEDARIDSAIEGDIFLTGWGYLDYTRYHIPGQGNPFNLRDLSKGDMMFEANVAAPTGTAEVYLGHTQLTRADY